MATASLPDYPHERVTSYNPDTGAEPVSDHPAAHALYRAEHFALQAEKYLAQGTDSSEEAALAQAWATIAHAHIVREQT